VTSPPVPFTADLRTLGIGFRDAITERIARAVQDLLVAVAGTSPEQRLSSPPVMDRALLQRGGYFGSFPDLIGGVVTFAGTESVHRDLLDPASAAGHWFDHAAPSDVVLAPAACYPLYAGCADQVLSRPVTAAIDATCYRHEPSDDPMRMRSFRMQEFVLIGEPEQAKAHADGWLRTGSEILNELGLSHDDVLAHDPFFGKVGGISASIQLTHELKRELVWTPPDGRPPVSLMSVNWHRSHFGEAYGIRLAGGDTAHSSCAAFGVDRIVLALRRQHGENLERWPDKLRSRLSLTA
jgi:seryl-tRNA synthetase